MIYLVCNDISQKAIPALPIRFQKMIQTYCFLSEHFLDDMVTILDVFSDCIYFAYPTKSGMNGTWFLVKHMNELYTYDLDNHKLEVAKIDILANRKVIKLSYCNNTSHLPKDYLRQMQKMEGLL
jgi:hypothetical protein